MLLKSLLAFSATAAPLVAAQGNSNNNDETVLGVYMFHRHGDRTPKALAPTNLTDLGYREVYTSGQYYRNRYIASDAEFRIHGVNADQVLQPQIQVYSPVSEVLENSAMGFLQALYPPVGDDASTETLRNGSEVDAPMNGYQLIPIEGTDTGEGSENSAWLQSTSGCAKAAVSSNEFFDSELYNNLLESTRDFYERLAPIAEGALAESELSFKNAYEIFDYIHVAEIHNETIPHSDDLLDDSVLHQLQTLADAQQWGLAYNESEQIRALSGMDLATQIMNFLEATIDDAGAHAGRKIGVQFGPYATFMSFFGLADLAQVSDNFTGVADYASAMTFELFTNASSADDSFPAEDDLYVRFLFHNGTTTAESEPGVYPLFGSGQDALSWKDFSDGVKAFAMGDQEDWCTRCGNSTGVCAPYSTESAQNDAEDADGGASGNGLSPAVNGVIGAMVTLVVVLGLEAAIMVFGGLTVISKKSLARGGSPAQMAEGTKA